MKVTIRYKELANNRKSIYLDIVDRGRRWSEGLQLYIEEETKPVHKKTNLNTVDIAEKIKARRLLELQTEVNGFRQRSDYSKDFVEYFEAQVEQRFNSGINHDTWRSAFKHLNIFSKGQLSFYSLDEGWMIKFKEYLQSRLAPNSSAAYFNVIKHGIHNAIRDQIINSSTALNVESPRIEDGQREFLTLNEIKLLIDTKCRRPIVKSAFLFGCLTGLRISDIQTITWGQLTENADGGFQIRHKQVKTGNYEYLPINSQAIDLIGERAEDEERIFSGLKYSAHNLHILQQWALLAGIKKHVTWHVARHTNACILLENGVDIYTVSKLLGHRNLSTTEIYAAKAGQPNPPLPI